MLKDKVTSLGLVTMKTKDKLPQHCLEICKTVALNGISKVKAIDTLVMLVTDMNVSATSLASTISDPHAPLQKFSTMFSEQEIALV